MPPPILPIRPPKEDQDPLLVWQEYIFTALSERVDGLVKNLDELAEDFRDHIKNEGNQYDNVSRKLDKLFNQNSGTLKFIAEFQQCREEFKEHVSATKRDHEYVLTSRERIKAMAWIAGALLSVAGAAQVVLPVLEKLLAHG